jgi:hypothetical protein
LRLCIGEPKTIAGQVFIKDQCLDIVGANVKRDCTFELVQRPDGIAKRIRVTAIVPGISVALTRRYMIRIGGVWYCDLSSGLFHMAPNREERWCYAWRTTAPLPQQRHRLFWSKTSS